MPSLLTPGDLEKTIQLMSLTDDQRDKFLQFVKGAGLFDERVVYAMHLFELKTDRPTIDRRLMTRYEVSIRTANRISAEALDMRRICATGMAQFPSKLKTDKSFLIGETK